MVPLETVVPGFSYKHDYKEGHHSLKCKRSLLELCQTTPEVHATWAPQKSVSIAFQVMFQFFVMFPWDFAIFLRDSKHKQINDPDDPVTGTRNRHIGDTDFAYHRKGKNLLLIYDI